MSLEGSNQTEPMMSCEPRERMESTLESEIHKITSLTWIFFFHFILLFFSPSFLDIDFKRAQILKRMLCMLCTHGTFIIIVFHC